MTASRHCGQPVDIPPRCLLCADTGWVQVTDERRHRSTCLNPQTCFCSAVEPCPICDEVAG